MCDATLGTPTVNTMFCSVPSCLMFFVYLYPNVRTITEVNIMPKCTLSVMIEHTICHSEGNYRGAAALYEQMIQENPDSLSYHEVISSMFHEVGGIILVFGRAC